MTVSAKQVYQNGDFGHRLTPTPPFGLLIIDFCNAFLDPDMLGGGNIGQAAECTRRILDHARQHGWAVAHSKIAYNQDEMAGNAWIEKVPRLKQLTETSRAADFTETLRPIDGEYVVRKTVPSAFFKSGLDGWLAARGVRGLLVAGCTTSGCVRASVVDALSLNLRTTVLADCVGDRAIDAHHASLIDIAAKYANVMNIDEFFRQVEHDS